MKIMGATVGMLAALLHRAGGKLEAWQEHARSQSAAVFETSDALHLNRARLDHLASLQLDLRQKRVLEVGAGIGLLSGFFEARDCIVVCIEGRADNIVEMRRRFPHREVHQIDLNRDTDLSPFGRFDIAFCYGTLYHLEKPEEALGALSRVADMLLLETCLTPGSHSDLHLVRESASVNQALASFGCRPTRQWVMERLRQLWRYAYTTVDQPDHPDFETDWIAPYNHGNHRAVFVACNTPLAQPKLIPSLPDRQPRKAKATVSA
jgi:hypothetical protein